MKIDVHDIPAYVLTNTSSSEYIQKGENALNHLHRLGYNQVTKYKGVNARSKGGDRSHHKILSDLNIPTPFIIFEDDIKPLRQQHIFDIPDNADALFLGTSRWSRAWNFWMCDSVIYSDISEDIVKVNNMLCAHALVVINDTYREVLRRCESYALRVESDSVCGDQYVVELMKLFNVYSVNEPVFAQDGKFLDATNRSIRSTGWTLEQAQEFYHQYVGSHHQKSFEQVIPTDKRLNLFTRFEPLNYT